MPTTAPSARGLACVVALVLVPTLVGCGGEPGGDDAPGPSPAATAATASPEPGASPGARPAYAADEADRAAVDAMLAQRAQAVRVRDEAAFLATVDDRDPRLVAQQRTLFANLARLRLARYDYETTGDQLLPDPVRRAGPREPVVRFQTVEHTQVADALTGAVGNVVRMTYVRRDGRWLVGQEKAAEQVAGGEGHLRPWFGGPVDVADRGTLVVLTDAADAGLADALADIVEESVTADAALLQVAPDRQVLVDATGNGPTVRLNTVDEEEAAAIYTGVFDVDAQGRRTTLSGGTIRINPDLTAAELTGDPGLLRHEVVHLLLRRYTGVLPMWLSEGVAEYARWYPLTTRDLRVTPELWQRVQAAPHRLPGAGVFQLDPAVNYLVSQAAAQHLLARGGPVALRSLLEGYRSGVDAGAGVDDGDLTDRLLADVYDTTEAEVVDGAWDALGELDR
ncbi:conserved exported hypothetical protein [Nocardioides sp. AX2bis]|nr:conserved exported hypothetical protein [Nocardioides sp. AX2bis]